MSDTPTTDLRDLLSRNLGDFPDKPSLPGKKTFFGNIVGIQADKSSQKETPLYRFTAKLTDQGKDVTDLDMAPITSAGFSLSDYEASAEFYLTPNAMSMLRRFLVTLGFAQNINFFDALKLDPHGNPTEQTLEIIKGLPVVVVTPASIEVERPDDEGMIRKEKVTYLNRCSMAGVKKAATSAAA